MTPSLTKHLKNNTHKAPVAFPIPRAFRHPDIGDLIQLNCCKNPNCKNYGVPAKNPPKDKDGKPKRGLGNDYKLTTTRTGKVLTCKLCSISTILINNRAYVLECMRVQQEHSLKAASCNNQCIEKGRGKGQPCKNVGKDILTYPENYIKRGINQSAAKENNKSGSQRYECRSCGKQFNVAFNAQLGQQNTRLNKTLFSSLVNKGVLNRIQELLGVSAPFIYNRIEFFYNQCIQFEQWHIKNNLH